MERDGLHQKLAGTMRTSFLVYYFNEAAGEDLVPSLGTAFQGA